MSFATRRGRYLLVLLVLVHVHVDVHVDVLLRRRPFLLHPHHGRRRRCGGRRRCRCDKSCCAEGLGGRTAVRLVRPRRRWSRRVPTTTTPSF